MVQGRGGKGKPVKDDYLLRYQVGITPAGCSTDGGQSQGQGNPEREASRREGKQGFSLWVHKWASSCWPAVSQRYRSE